MPRTARRHPGDVTAEGLRARLVDDMVADGHLTDPAVEAAFRAVPRHMFAPEASLSEAYTRGVVPTKADENGRTISSVSAPDLQAIMLERAGVRPGERVLEIGSGGYNAALLAELVGPAGSVTTVDIDADIVGRARAFLADAGYERVAVVHADGEYGCPDRAPFHRIIVTVGAWDVPPAWIDQLTPDGTLTVPLLMRGITRAVTLERTGDHLRARASIMCGFVSMQGAGTHEPQRVTLRDGAVRLLVDDARPLDPGALEAAFDTGGARAWSGVTVAAGEPFESLLFWLATVDDGACQLRVDPGGDAGPLAPWSRHVDCPAIVTHGTLAHLALRETNGGRHEFGALALGPDAEALAGRMVDLVRAWNRDHRDGPGPSLAVYRRGRGDPPPGGLVLTKRHSQIVVSWGR